MGTTRASRLLSILTTLQARERVTAQALADENEVSLRTIYRDIEALSAAGIPVYSERGQYSIQLSYGRVPEILSDCRPAAR